MKWPAKIPEGLVYEEPVISLDIFATAIGQTKKPVTPKNPLDGVNLIPYLTGEETDAPHDFLFWRKFDAKDYAVRNGVDKLFLDKKENKQLLFNLGKDISEVNNTAENNVSRVNQLINDINNWENKMVGPRFMGLLQDKEYSKLNTDRYKRPEK